MQRLGLWAWSQLIQSQIMGPTWPPLLIIPVYTSSPVHTIWVCFPASFAMCMCSGTHTGGRQTNVKNSPLKDGKKWRQKTRQLFTQTAPELERDGTLTVHKHTHVAGGGGKRGFSGLQCKRTIRTRTQPLSPPPSAEASSRCRFAASWTGVEKRPQCLVSDPCGPK